MKNKNEYEGRISPDQKRWGSSPWTALLKERYYLASLACENKVVLDSCCGTAWGTMKYIVPKALRVSAFDACPLPVHVLEQNKEMCSFHIMDAREIKLENNSFDVVLALDSIEHFTREDALKYLQGMERVCKKTGVIFGTTPLVPHKKLIPDFLAQNKYHLFMYTEKVLKNTLSSIFPVVKIYRIYNPACPYFLFLCGKTGKNGLSDIEKNIDLFLLKKKNDHIKGRIFAYIHWARSLIVGKRTVKKIRLAYSTLLSKIGILPEGANDNSPDERT